MTRPSSAAAGTLGFLALVLSSYAWLEGGPLVNTPGQKTAEPTELVQALLRNGKELTPDDLEKLGLCPSSISPDVRLLFANLDEDEETEAIVASDCGGGASAIVLDKQGPHWYRVAHAKSWAAHHDDPLEIFLEVRDLVGTEQKDLLIRQFRGGTGIEGRDLVVYRMRGSSFVEILRFPEEDWACYPWVAESCAMQREVLYAHFQFAPGRIVLWSFVGYWPADEEGRPVGDPDWRNPLWWKFLRPLKCEAYAWNEEQFRFVADPQATAAHCKETPAPTPNP